MPMHLNMWAEPSASDIIVLFDNVILLPVSVVFILTCNDTLMVICFCRNVAKTKCYKICPSFTYLIFTLFISAKDKADIEPMVLLDLMGGSTADLNEFYRYSGSLTTPGCFESVTWTVFEKVLKVSAAQVSISSFFCLSPVKPYLKTTSIVKRPKYYNHFTYLEHPKVYLIAMLPFDNSKASMTN